MIGQSDCDFVFITETWLQENDVVLKKEMTPNGYQLFSAERKERPGGGVAVLYKQCISKIKSEHIDNFQSFECLKIIALDTTFICLYHPPPSKTNMSTKQQFIDELKCLLESVINSSDRLIILGDFNIHFDDKSEHYNRSIQSFLNNHGLLQHINSPTHEKGHIIDWVITNSPIISNIRVRDITISDHFAIDFNVDKISKKKAPPRCIKVRNIKQIDLNQFSADLAEKLSNYQESNSNHDVDADLLNSVLQETLNDHAPVMEKVVRDRPSAPWITETVHDARRRCRAAERKWRRSNSTSHREIYRRRIRDLATIITSEKKEFLCSKIDNCTSSKELFNVVNKMSGKSSEVILPTSIPPDELPNTFIDYFDSKVANIRKDIDACQRDCIDFHVHDVKFDGLNFNCFRNVTPSEVRDVIQSSAPKSCDLDPIPTDLLIKCLDTILPYITDIINHSLNSGIVPACFKSALISPLLKKSNLDPENLKNYRPISNLPFLSKILEKVVLAQLKEHLLSNNLLDPRQSAYRECHSTETALLKITNDLLLSGDEGNVSVLTLLDLSAAFDTIDHSILCQRLKFNFGINGVVLNWFISYLGNRSQTVKINESTSVSKSVVFGVPQGSVLGPVLYTLYVKPLSTLIKSHEVNNHMFADDTQLYKSCPISVINSVFHDVEACCDNIKQWMQSNKLKLNEDKTEVIICGSNKRIGQLPNMSLSIGGSVIQVSDKVKNLGVTLDTCLTMDDHINNMIKTINFELKKINQLKRYLNPNCLKILVCSFVLSRLDYCNALLAGIPDCRVAKLQRVQNRAARLVLGLDYFDRTNTSVILTRLHWLPIKARIEYKIAVLCFRALKGDSPSYIQELLQPHCPGRHLRSGDKRLLSIPKTKLVSFGDRSFSVVGPSIWNSLPLSLRMCDSITLFKSMLKTHLFINHLR